MDKNPQRVHVVRLSGLLLHTWRIAARQRGSRLRSYDLSNQVRHTNNEGVPHAERTPAVAHPRIRPALGETLEHIELIRDEASVPAILAADDVLEARGASAALTRENRA